MTSKEAQLSINRNPIEKISEYRKTCKKAKEILYYVRQLNIKCPEQKLLQAELADFYEDATKILSKEIKKEEKKLIIS